MASQDIHMSSAPSSSSRMYATLALHSQLISRIKPSDPVVTDRLPTVSASQALQTLQVKGSRAVATGLPQLDETLAPHALPGRIVSGGYPRGKVTEIFGPSGVGKTAFG